jgi:hypothetical protein
MHTDPERPSDFPPGAPDRNDDRAIDPGVLRARPDIAAGVGLNVAGRDRAVALRRQAGHPLADRNPAHDLDDAGRNAHLALQDEHPVLEPVEGPGVGAEAADELFEPLLHGLFQVSTPGKRRSPAPENMEKLDRRPKE